MANIESYSKCECGAITINFNNGASNSMYQKTAKKLGIDLRKYKSGEEVGKCSCGLNKAHDEFGVKFDSLAAFMKGFYMA